jgi:hypothetical protein
VLARKERVKLMFKIMKPLRRLQELRRKLTILHREAFHPLLHQNWKKSLPLLKP